MSHMEWSNDSIVNAITKCQQQRALFIVYVKDESTGSNTSDAAWNSREVFDVLSSNPHVAIRLVKDSLECQQFSQLFPVLLTPCLFCIGNKGDILESASGAMDPTQLAQLLIKAFQKHSPDSTVVPPTQNESVSETRPLEENEETIQSDPLEEQQTDKDEKLDLQEKKQLLRQKKDQEAKEKEKERELRRRKEGQQLEEWKKDKEDLERQQWLKERRRQKLEIDKARQEVLAKLEQDKRERAAQRKRLKQQSSEETSDITTTKVAGPPASNSTYSKSARVQVKMSNGRTTVLTLSSSDTVSTLRQQIAEFMEADIDSFSMTSGYPRTDLTPELDETPISNHGLAPSGVVIVKFNNQKGGSSFSPSGDGGVLATVWGVFAAVIQFIVMIFKYIKDSIFTGGGSGSNSQPSSTRSSINRGSNQHFRKFNQDDFKDDDDDKRKETYNGNSTQQL